MADYKTPQWLLPNEKNLAYPAAGDGITGSGLSEDRHSLYSMDFNGTDYISAPNTFLNSASVCTLSFWMKGTGEVGGGAPWNGIQIQAGATTTSFRTMNGSNINNYVSFSPGTDWHHYLGVYVGGSYSKLYIDGVLKSTLSTGIPATLASTSGDIFKIGYGQSYSVAKIDEVALWNRQLTDGGVADGATAGGEIATIYNSGSPGNLMGLSFKPIAYYPLGEQAQMGSANWSFPNGSLQSHVVDFDGSTDSIGIPETIYSGAFTFSFWLKPDNLTLAFIAGDINSNSNFIWLQSSTIISLKASGSTYNFTESAGNDITTGSWQNITITRDSSNNVEAFRNGVPFGGTSVLAGDFKLNSIGQVYSAIGNWLFNGLMSNIAIWNSDQSTNIDNIYNNGSPQSTYTTTPTAWWKLNAANSSYVYPWSLELNGNPDVSGGGDFAKVVSNALQVQDINTTGTSGKVDFLTREITGAYSGINVTGEFIVYAASSGQSGATLYYKIDGGSWVQFQQELRTDNTATTYAIAGASGLTSTTSFQVKIEFETGSIGTPYVTLNNISIGDLYTEDFTNQDGAGWDLNVNSEYIPPPVNWTFIDTETPAPNYSSALNFDGTVGEIALTSDFVAAGEFTLSLWINPDNVVNNNFLGNGGAGSNWLQIKTASQIKIRIASSAAIAFTESGGNDLTASAWNHILIYRDSSNNVGAYVNGQTFGSAGSNTSTLTLSTIGRATGIFFEGDISNTAFWTSDQSANIATLYNGGTPETSISFSPTSWWKLDNTTTGIQDSGSASNNGTNNGATQIATNVLISNNGESDTLPTSALTPSDLQFESPYSNYSLSFDGADDYVNFGNSSLLNFGNGTSDSPFSLSVWFYRPSSPANNSARILTKDDEWELRIAGSSSNSLYLQLNDSTAYRRRSGTFAGTGWHHIAATYSGSGDTTDYGIKIYVDGVRIDDTNLSSGTYVAMNNESGDTNLARLPNGTGYTAGKFDELAVFNSNLTQTQVNQVYNNGYPADLTSLSPICWWRLGEDAFFVSNVVTIPNKITGGPSGTGGGGDQSAFLVGDAPGSYANGSGTNLVVTDRIGDASESTANSVSINMIPSNRISYPAGYVPTQVDNAFSMAFDGVSNSKFNVNPPAIGSDNTISAWAKRVGTGNMFLLGNTNSGGYGCYFVGTSGVYVQGSGGYFAFTNSAVTTAMVRTDWVNWVFIKNSSAGTVSVYVDGELAQSASSTGGMDSLTSIGGSGLASGNQFPWNGNIDEVALFNYALSERQIKQDIYEGTTTGKTADLNNISNLTAPVAWYRMGD